MERSEIKIQTRVFGVEQLFTVLARCGKGEIDANVGEARWANDFRGMKNLLKCLFSAERESILSREAVPDFIRSIDFLQQCLAILFIAELNAIDFDEISCNDQRQSDEYRNSSFTHRHYCAQHHRRPKPIYCDRSIPIP
jgi:hypothetical protein